MKALIAQLDPVPGDTQRNAATVSEAINGHRDVNLAVFPELFLGGYDLADVMRNAVTTESDEITSIRGACERAGTAAIVGFAEQTDSGVANSAIAIDVDGTVAGVARKTHLFGGERDVFVAGDRLNTVELAGATIGPMICFDVEFPEVARTLAERETQLLVTVAANMDPFGDDHEIFVRARAMENAISHLYVNRVGSQDGYSFTGRSAAVDSRGAVLNQLTKEPQLQEVDLPLAHGQRDPRLDYLGQRRPDLYATRKTEMKVS